MAILRALLFFSLLLPATARGAEKRVVSLMPSYTEIIFALGAGGQVAGVSNYCNYPPEAAAAEKTGDYLNPSVEKIFSLKPDLVFAGGWSSGARLKALKKLKTRLVLLPEEKSVEDIHATIARIAAELGREKEGKELSARLRAMLPAPRPGKPVRVYLEADAGGWTTGNRSFLSDAIRLAGGVNVFGEEKRGYFQATWEETLLMEPEAVILLGGSEAEFRSRGMAATLPAVKAGKIITTLDRDAFARPGPRLFGEIVRLEKLLYEGR